MTQRAVIEFRCDVTGKVLTPENHHVRTLTVGRKTYQFDLDPLQSKNFDASITKWLERGTHVPKKRKKRRK